MNQQRPPNRGRIPDYLKGGYTPEHVRLDIEPKQAGVNAFPQKVASVKHQRPSVQAPDPQPVIRVPPNPRIQVGNNEEWFTQHRTEPQNKPKPRIAFVDNNDYVDTASLQGADGSVQDFDQDFEWQEEQPQSSSEQSNLQFPLPADVYIVFCGDIFIKVSDDINIIRRTIESLIIEQNQNIDSVTVLKSLEVDFGVLLR